MISVRLQDHFQVLCFQSEENILTKTGMFPPFPSKKPIKSVTELGRNHQTASVTSKRDKVGLYLSLMSTTNNTVK